MSGAAAKKVLIERFDRVTVRGYVQSLPEAGGAALEVLTPEGSVIEVPLGQVKAVCFVREFDGPSIFNEKKEFSSRPKSRGLWVRVRFADGDAIEGMIPNSLTALGPPGYTINPPEIAGNTQRIWVPMKGVQEFVVLGVVGTPKRAKARRAGETGRQIGLFAES